MQTAKADSRALRHVLGLCVLFYPSMVLCDIVVWICPLRQWICVLLSLDLCSSSLDLCVFVLRISVSFHGFVLYINGFVFCYYLCSSSTLFCFIVLSFNGNVLLIIFFLSPWYWMNQYYWCCVLPDRANALMTVNVWGQFETNRSCLPRQIHNKIQM